MGGWVTAGPPQVNPSRPKARTENSFQGFRPILGWFWVHWWVGWVGFRGGGVVHGWVIRKTWVGGWSGPRKQCDGGSVNPSVNLWQRPLTRTRTASSRWCTCPAWSLGSPLLKMPSKPFLLQKTYCLGARQQKFGYEMSNVCKSTLSIKSACFIKNPGRHF